MSEIILLAYDIAAPNRLRKVAKLCEAYGTRVQDSVFEMHLKPAKLVTLQLRLLKLINPAQDKIRYYRICAADFADIAVDGKGAKTQPHHYSVV